MYLESVNANLNKKGIFLIKVYACHLFQQVSHSLKGNQAGKNCLVYLLRENGENILLYTFHCFLRRNSIKYLDILKAFPPLGILQVVDKSGSLIRLL